MTDANREALGVENGVVVSEVLDGSPASEAGLQAGDVIVSLDRKTVNTVEEFTEMVANLPRDKSFPVLVQRESAAIFRAIKIPSSKE